MLARPSGPTDITKVRISSKDDAKRRTFKYSTDLIVFVWITDWGAALFVLYICHFSIVSDVLRCVGKVSSPPFQPSRYAFGKLRWSGLTVSTIIHVETLMPLPQVLFTSANPSALLGISKVHAPTKFHAKRLTFELDMICFLFVSDLITLCSTTTGRFCRKRT